MKTLFGALAGLALMTGAAQSQCYEILNDGESARDMGGYSVGNEASRPGLMDAPSFQQDSLGIMCDRYSVVPEPHDFELVRYHRIPLLIRTGVGDDATILMLYFRSQSENEDGTVNPPQYAVQLPQGELSEADREGIIAAIEGFAEAESLLETYMELTGESGNNR